MRAFYVLLTAVLVTVLAACTSDDGTSGGGTGSAFRNLGKRADSNLAGQAAGDSVR
jgi:hypothetical protein